MKSCFSRNCILLFAIDELDAVVLNDDSRADGGSFHSRALSNGKIRTRTRARIYLGLAFAITYMLIFHA